MTPKTNHEQITSERNTYFSSLVSQKEDWTIEEILCISKNLLIPFKYLKEENLEPSTQVSMLYDMVNLLPCKLEYYKSIINEIYRNKGIDCNDLIINVFNADCGIDSIAFINGLISKGYKLEHIKTIRLFSSDKEKLKRAVLLHKKLYPLIPLKAYNMDIKDIENECICNSLLTINLFLHTFNLAKDIYKEISRIIIRSHYIYSHSIFLENITHKRMPQVSDIDCRFYWEDLNMCRFYKNDSRTFSLNYTNPDDGEKYYAQYAIFSNLSLETLDINHKYKIVLEGLCPGIPYDTLFNENRKILLFDKPFQNDKLCNDVNDTDVVLRDIDYNIVWNNKKIDYTLRKIIKEFPQYSISEGLNNNEEWANEVVDYYLNAAENGNTQCYNNIGALKTLCSSFKDNSNDIHSEQNKEIIKFFTLASKGGDTNAMINLASLYMFLEDYANAIIYYKMASDNGQIAGSYSMGIVYHFGMYGKQKNEDLAIEYYKKGIEQYLKATDDSSYAPINNCCLNLIILMYENDYTLCDITKEFNKIKNASPQLTYAYTVISNNLSNKSKDLFKVLKLNLPEKDEPAYITYNRICALYEGIKTKNECFESNKVLALEQLKQLANTTCPNWPDWEKYVWSTLASWTSEAKENHATYSTYWIKASKANPKNACAYRTNMATFSQLDEEEVMSIWHEYAYGNGCERCDECTSYDKTSRCCPKAQFKWATTYEKDTAVAKFLIEEAMRQGFNPALQYLAIDKVKEELLPSEEEYSLDNLYFNSGAIPDTYKQIINEFTSGSRYKLLCRAADNGSRRAALILAEVSKLRNCIFESIYWSAVGGKYKTCISILQKITNKSFDGDFFNASSLKEHDLITLSNKRVEQFKKSIFTSDFDFLEKLAEFYVRGKLYHKAIELYKIAANKGIDVNKRINELEEEIERFDSLFSYDQDSDNYEEPDYARDSWDAMTDGMYGDMPDGFNGDYSFLGY